MSAGLRGLASHLIANGHSPPAVEVLIKALGEAGIREPTGLAVIGNCGVVEEDVVEEVLGSTPSDEVVAALKKGVAVAFSVLNGLVRLEVLSHVAEQSKEAAASCTATSQLPIHPPLLQRLYQC